MTTNKQSRGVGNSALAKISNRALGFVRVATVSPRLKVADCQFNVGEIISAMQRAQAENVEVLVTPELSITGYTCADLFHQTTLIEGAKEGLKAIVDASEQFDGILFVGLPLVLDDKLYNCAVAVKGGIVLGVVPKSYLPNYKEFYEQRWFACAEVAHSKEIVVLGRTVQFGNDLLFQTDSVEGLSIAVDVCEDLWAVIPPSSLAALSGATLIVNLSASNELVGKSEYRRDLVVGQSGRLIAGYAYVSSGVDESTTDVVFGGHAMIALDGSLVQESPRFAREAVFTVADLDIERLRIDRIGNTSFSEAQRKFARTFPYRKRMFHLWSKAKAADQIGLRAYVDGQPFVPKDGFQLKARCEDIFNIQVAGLAKRLEKLGGANHLNNNWGGVTIGVSGGLDSTLALLVTVKAFDLLGIDRRKIKGYTLPGFGTTSRTKGNAHSLMQQLGITAQEVDIREMCLAQMRTEGHKPFGIDLAALNEAVQAEYLALVRATAIGAPIADPNEMAVKKFTEKLIALQADGAELKDLHFENVQARARTKILMDNGFTIGTGDLSELAIGWCTYNGDHMSMYGVNAGVPKTLVKLLVRWAAGNQFEGQASATLLDIFNTDISPELLPTDKDGKIVQKTESVVGPFELTDFFLYHMQRYGARPEKILALAEHATFQTKYSTAHLQKWLKLFIGLFFNAQFKRSCLPDCPKVGSISLSPRGDWRMPSDAEATLWLEWAKSLGGSTESDPTAATAASDQSTNNVTPPPMTKEITTAATPIASAFAKIYRVLLRVDIQNGFCPGGNLAVTQGDLIVPLANRLSLEGGYDEVIDSQDFHPKDHGAFLSQNPGKRPGVDTVMLNGVPHTVWPDHCVEGTADADFHPDLDRSMVKKTVQKGLHPGVHSYGAFYDDGKNASVELKAKYPFLGQSTGLAEYIIAQANAAGADEVAVDVIGLALDYCVGVSAKDAAAENYKGKPFAVRVIIDGTRAIGDTDAAAADLVAHGVAVIDSSAVLPAAVSN